MMGTYVYTHVAFCNFQTCDICVLKQIPSTNKLPASKSKGKDVQPLRWAPLIWSALLYMQEYELKWTNELLHPSIHNTWD